MGGDQPPQRTRGPHPRRPKGRPRHDQLPFPAELHRRSPSTPARCHERAGQPGDRQVVRTIRSQKTSTPTRRRRQRSRRSQTPSERSRHAQDRRRDRGARDELVRLEAENTGKPADRVGGDPPMSTSSGSSPVRRGSSRASRPGVRRAHGRIRREPIGVVGQVTPWNYPMMMASGRSVRRSRPATPSSSSRATTTPETTLLLAEIVAKHAGGHPQRHHRRPGHRTGARQPDPRLVAITGSVRAGMQVRARATSSSGSTGSVAAPVVVFDDADIGPLSPTSARPDASTRVRLPRHQSSSPRAPTTTSSRRCRSRQAGQVSLPDDDTPCSAR